MGDVHAQILYAGLTDRVLPMGPHPRGIFVDHTHNHWQTVQSLKAFLFYLDSSVNSREPRQPWACVLDVAPVHGSAEFLKDIRLEAPWIKLVFVNPGWHDRAFPAA